MYLPLLVVACVFFTQGHFALGASFLILSHALGDDD